MPAPLELVHPAPRAIVGRLLAGQRALLGDVLTGLYLGGSLAAGDFDPETSDIDFLALTAGGLDEAQVGSLAALHRELFDSGDRWGTELEGSYIPVDRINSAGTTIAEYPRLERGEPELTFLRHDCDWTIHRFLYREHGLALLGPPTAELLDPVTPDMLRAACRQLYREWWQPMLTDSQRLLHLGYRCYGAQAMCRMLYTVEHGTVVSKPVAAHWALERLPSQYGGVIGATLERPRAEGACGLESVLGLIQYTGAHL